MTVVDLTHLGKYEIRRVLGEGAMGVVYLAFDPHIERLVAIKTIRKNTLDADLALQFMARFKNEARAAGRLHHPNIVGVYEYGEDEHLTFIEMEYVEGNGLREYLHRHANFNFGQLVALMSQLLEALEFAHGRGVVHRDIKPSNLIVTPQGVLKVADFGIARVDTSNLTSIGTVIGTPSYMSPEQCRGKEIDARSDLFSAGVVLYELLTGEKPFRGPAETVAYKICHEEPAPPSQHPALTLPPAVDQLVATALAKDPLLRFSDARAFHDALREVAKLGVEVDEGSGPTLVSIGTVVLQQPAPFWDDATLETAEHELARALGPMAKVIVHKAAAQTHDRAELCLLLSETIDDLDNRRKFVDAFNHGTSGLRVGTTGARGSRGGARSTQSSGERAGSLPGGAATAAVDAAFVDRVTARLAVHIGPIARIVTRKAAQQAHGRGEFLRLVAEHVNQQDRAAFLREVGFGET